MKNKDLYCLIGYPVSHSLSPAMHNSAFRDSCIEAVYTTMTVKPEELGSSISSLRKLNVKGVNVTMPLKEKVMQQIDSIDENAGKIGAVNTIVNEKGILKGYNTDALGGAEAVSSAMKDSRGKEAVILGRGGTARAIAFGLEKIGMHTQLLGRDAINGDDLSPIIKEADIVCNCTPIGMIQGATPIPKKLLRKDLVVFDAVYANEKTALIRDAEKGGCKTINGIQLLLNQGVHSFKLWTGVEPNRKIMSSAIKERIRINRQHLRRNIYFVGFMGSGKSSVGELSAKRIKRKFIDIDNEISTQLGSSIREIFDNFGEEEFRKIERREIERVSQNRGHVIAPGGGSVLNFENVSRMKNTGTVVFLSTKPSNLLSRLRREGSRPLMAGTDDELDPERIRALLKDRMPYYNLAKDLEIITDGKGVQSLANEVVQRIGDFE